MKTEAFGVTDVGRCRKGNEDGLLVDPSLGVFAVADGMGGHAAGEIASQLAIEALAEVMLRATELEEPDPRQNAESAAKNLELAFKEGNKKICDSVLTRADWQGMGTTIVAMMTAGNRAVIGHVGDSRAYLLRDDQLHRLTSDHSYVNEQVKLGLITEAEARKHPMRNIVTRALGNRDDLQVDLAQQEIRAGDLYMLCSDGLNTMLQDDQILSLMREHAGDPKSACHALVEQANEHGGEDNVTVVVVRAT